MKKYLLSIYCCVLPAHTRTFEEKEHLSRIIDAATEGDCLRFRKSIKKHLWSRTSPLINAQNEAGTSPLLAGCRGGNDDLIIYIFEHHTLPSLELPDNNGMTPLLATCAYGKANTARLLLERGADPNSINNHGKTPLLFAAERGYKKLVHLLLRYKADPFAKDNQGLNALDYAAQNNDLQTARLLLEKGVQADTQSAQKLLTLALQKRDGTTKKLLLKQGAIE